MILMFTCAQETIIVVYTCGAHALVFLNRTSPNQLILRAHTIDSSKHAHIHRYIKVYLELLCSIVEFLEHVVLFDLQPSLI